MWNPKVQHSSTCLQEPRKEDPPTRGLGSGLVSLVPYLGDALGVVGIKKNKPPDVETGFTLTRYNPSQKQDG